MAPPVLLAPPVLSKVTRVARAYMRRPDPVFLKPMLKGPVTYLLKVSTRVVVVYKWRGLFLIGVPCP